MSRQLLEEVFEEPIASRSMVSRICEGTRERRQWRRRRLEEHGIVYLFLDAIYLKLRPEDAPSEGVPVCWGVTLQGREALLGLAPHPTRKIETGRLRSHSRTAELKISIPRASSSRVMTSAGRKRATLS
jgi:Transposase, Mutator family